MLHTRISYIKSAVRILGFLVLCVNLYLGAAILIAAEFIGILEEKVVDVHGES